MCQLSFLPFHGICPVKNMYRLRWRTHSASSTLRQRLVVVLAAVRTVLGAVVGAVVRTVLGIVLIVLVLLLLILLAVLVKIVFRHLPYLLIGFVLQK